MDTQDLYCKIYVNSEQDRSALLRQVAALCLGAVTGRTVSSTELVIDISRNEDSDPVRADASDGFVYFPYYMDVLPANGVGRTIYIAAIRKLILGLRQMAGDTVAACDFEDELGESGNVA